MKVVVEAEAVAAERAVERLFAGMAKGRMPDVVRQRQRLGQLRIQSQRLGHGARNLRHFKGVREAAAKVVGKSLGGQAGKNLRLAGQAAKGARMQNPRGVARKRSAVGDAAAPRERGATSALSALPSTAIPAGKNAEIRF